jgi:hypothetical protein
MCWRRASAGMAMTLPWTRCARLLQSIFGTGCTCTWMSSCTHWHFICTAATAAAAAAAATAAAAAALVRQHQQPQLRACAAQTNQSVPFMLATLG